MKNKYLTLIVVVALAALSLTAGPAGAQATSSNILGNYSGYFVAQSITYTLGIAITSEDFEAGTFSGLFNGQDISGTIDGPNIAWGVPGLGGDGGAFFGTVNADGSLGGNMYYDGPGGRWNGFWGVSGHALLNGQPGIAVQPSPVFGGQTATGTVSLDYLPANPGVTVLLFSSSPVVSVPTSVTIGPSQAWVSFPVTTSKVTTEEQATITASFDDPSSPITAIVTVQPDTPPVWGAPTTGTNGEGQATASVTVQAAKSGLASISVRASSNCQIAWASFTPGTTSPILITATKTNQSQKASFTLEATDESGNSSTFDPIIITLTIPRGGSSVSRTLQNVPAAEHFLTVTNGVFGLRRFSITVNDRQEQGDLANGQLFTEDLAPAMRAGGNTVTLAASGQPGSSATVMIGDHPGAGCTRGVTDGGAANAGQWGW